jgi:hypothetical protein
MASQKNNLTRKQFKAEVLSVHKDNAVEVPFDPSEVWGVAPKPLWRGRRGHEVHGRLNGFHFESCIVPRQKRFFMIIDEDIRKQAKLSVGDIVTASVKPLVK